MPSYEIILYFQLPVVKELGDEAFSYVFEGSELLAKLTEGLDPVECESRFYVYICTVPAALWDQKIIDSATYCNQILLVPLYLTSTQKRWLIGKFGYCYHFYVGAK